MKTWPLMLGCLLAGRIPPTQADDFLISLRTQGDSDTTYTTRGLRSGTTQLRMSTASSSEIDWFEDHWVASAAYAGSLAPGVQMSNTPQLQRWKLQARCQGQGLSLEFDMITPQGAADPRTEQGLHTRVHIQHGHWVDILGSREEAHDQVIYSTRPLLAPSLQVRVDALHKGTPICP